MFGSPEHVFYEHVGSGTSKYCLVKVHASCFVLYNRFIYDACVCVCVSAETFVFLEVCPLQNLDVSLVDLEGGAESD